MPSGDKWVTPTISNDVAVTAIAAILGIQPHEVRGWVIIAHIHPDQEDHETRMASNMPDGMIPQLMMDGIDAI